uniref:Immunoglobulin domain-containing protein n=1 Tax=Sinocyclocheilus grahami TaxID=75366 RepID=A0A672MX53_SINGR
MICRKGHFHSIFLFYNFVWLIVMLISSGYADAVSVSVMRGDSVTLHTDVETNQQEEISWYFNSIRIAEISADPSKTCTDVQCEDADERFRDRLKLVHQTGSLTITNITITDSGLYKLQITSSSDSLLQLFSVSVYCESLCSLSDPQSSHILQQLLVCVSDVPKREKMKRMSVKEGESVTLDPGVMKTTNYLMKWLFNDIRIAEINGDLSFICTDVQCLYADERFRDRLKLNHMTGSLTITNTRSEDTGLYYLLIITIRFSIRRSFIVDVTSECYLGDSVILHTDVETNQQEEIRWYFNDTRIAQITEDLSFIYADERFRDRLKLDHQTGSLAITNITTTESGLYQLQISSSSRRISIIKSFSVTVPMMEGDSVILYTDVETIQQEEIRWYFNDIRIAEITGDQSHICTDDQCEDADERFRDRLKLDHQTGSLTIRNINTTDSGLYKLQTNSSSDSRLQLFSVSVYGESLCPLYDHFNIHSPLMSCSLFVAFSKRSSSSCWFVFQVFLNERKRRECQ